MGQIRDFNNNNLTKEDIADIHYIIDRITSCLDCREIYLFGSYANGKPHKDSDLDLFIVLNTENLRPVDAGIKARLSLGKYDRLVDIVAQSPSQFDKRKNIFGTFSRTVYNTGVLIYE